MSKPRSNAERLLRDVDTSKLCKVFELWKAMDAVQRKAFASNHCNSVNGIKAIKRELERRQHESGIDILTAICNGEKR